MLFIFSLVVIALALISGFLMLWRLPVLQTGPDQIAKELQNSWPKLTIIIPARNEQQRLPPLLESLSKQDYDDYELIVVDDQSDDDTGKLAQASGARVIRTDRLDDESWIGKSFACWTGAEAANGAWLLFLDADTRLERPDSLRRLLSSYAKMQGSGILSLQPYHRTQKFYESFSAIFNIIVIAGMNSFTPWGDKIKSAGSFGPCIMMNKQEYFQTGGHKSVSSAVMDDLALGVLYQKHGLATVGCSGRGLISFRMYPEGFRSLFEGWTKSFGTASASTHPLVFAMIIAWISGGFSTVALLIRSIVVGSPFWLTTAIVSVILYMLQLIFQARRTGNFKILMLVLYPLQHIFFTVLFLWSLFMTKVLHTVNWRGRKIKV